MHNHCIRWRTNFNQVCSAIHGSCNSTLRVERRKWGNAGEREVRRTRSKVIASCRAREWEPEAEWHLPDENMEIGCLSDCNYRWHAGGGWGGEGSTGAGTRGGHCHEANLKCFMNKFCHKTFFFILPLDEQFVHLLVSLLGFRWQQFVVDDSVRLCVSFLYDWILHSRF